MSITLEFHGATEGVTGSCHQISFAKESLLVDCGIFQGKEARRHNDLTINFDISNLKGLILTHAHLDHIGRIPYLLASGYTGPIYTSIPTSYLLPEQLEDALKIGFTKDRKLIKGVVNVLKKRIIPCEYKQWILVSDCFKIKFHPAGHILGSSFVEIAVKVISGKKYKSLNNTKRIVFSGDLGPPYTPILSMPCSPYQADIVVLESTYGDRIHSGRKDRRHRLLNILKKSLSDNGIIIIPAFAIGRTQELLYELNEIVEKGKLPRIPVIIDSPLANKFTALYSDLKDFWDKESRRSLKGGDDPFVFPGLVSINSYRDHLKILRRLNDKGGPAIVIAGSGMCTGGRVVNYLKDFLSDCRNDILFVGYQAYGTPGRDIITYGSNNRGRRYVTINGKRVGVGAGVHEVSGYSAHADKDNLVRWVKRIRKKPSKIFLVHGDIEAKKSLKKELNTIELNVIIARKKRYSIDV